MMTRQKFIETITADGYQFLKTDDYTARNWYKKNDIALAFGSGIQPYGLTLINIKTHARLVLDSWENSYVRLKAFESKIYNDPNTPLRIKRFR